MLLFETVADAVLPRPLHPFLGRQKINSGLNNCDVSLFCGFLLKGNFFFRFRQFSNPLESFWRKQAGGTLPSFSAPLAADSQDHQIMRHSSSATAHNNSRQSASADNNAYRSPKSYP